MSSTKGQKARHGIRMAQGMLGIHNGTQRRLNDGILIKCIEQRHVDFIYSVLETCFELIEDRSIAYKRLEELNRKMLDL